MPEGNLQCLSLWSFGCSVNSSCSMWLNPASVLFLPCLLQNFFLCHYITADTPATCYLPKPNLTRGSYSQLYFNIGENHLNLAAGAHPHGKCCSLFPTSADASLALTSHPCSVCAHRNAIAKIALPHILTLLPNLPRRRGLEVNRRWDKGRGQGCQD